ncbi:hypothetical protein BDZ91DRAFT_793883 [Kalaharituber pfeilii]|nr:hypothetical protein BDZ91DRAFT_793883 [Kalaharituber pfeilii]
MTENAGTTPEELYQKSTFACNLHALATIKSIQELNHHHHLRPLNTYFGQETLPEDVEKHLTLLDAISLLLIAHRRSDVAAVGLFVGDKGFPALYYAKNAPCTDTEKAHVNSIVSFIKNVADKDTKAKVAEELFQLVLPFCKEKVWQRLKKLQQQLRDNGWDGLDSNEFRAKVCETFDSSPEATKFLDDLLSKIKGLKSFPDNVRKFL